MPSALQFYQTDAKARVLGGSWTNFKPFDGIGIDVPAGGGWVQIEPCWMGSWVYFPFIRAKMHATLISPEGVEYETNIPDRAYWTPEWVKATAGDHLFHGVVLNAFIDGPGNWHIRIWRTDDDVMF
jgi:hypothetical protein